ncbi:MAG: PAS domain S-box protein, partial [Rhodospirillales bacterium]|nr:PAS domain S-box protein [Rhodospirillales bacterium]
LENLLGYSVEDVIGTKLADLYSEADGRDKFLAAMQAGGGAISDFRAKLKRKDGKIAWVSSSSRFIYDDERTVVGVEGIARDVTNQVHESEDRFRIFFEEAAIGTVFLSLDGKIMDANSAYHYMLGYDEGDLIGKSIPDITHPDDAKLSLDTLEGIVSNKSKTTQFEKRYLHRTGSVVWVWVSMAVVRDAKGNPLHVISQITDVTERKLAERARLLSEERFKDIASAAGNQFWEMDRDFIYRYYLNEDASSAIGADEYVGRRPWEMVVRDSDLQDWLEFREILERRQTFRKFTIKVPSNDGAGRTLSYSGTPIYDDKGEFAGYRGITSNETAEVQLELQLINTERRFHDAMESLDAAFSLWDPDNRLVYCNRQYRALMNLDENYLTPGSAYEELIGAAYEINVDDKETITRDAWIAERLDEMSGRGGDYVNRRPNGSYINIRKYTLEDGSKVTFHFDVTDAVRREEELKTEKSVAEKANRAKSEFLSSMSHELRTPLNAILGFAQLLEHVPKEPLTENQRDYTGLIIQSGEHLLSLIEQVLELSKIESGQINFSMEDVQIDDVIVQCINMMEGLAGQFSVNISHSKSKAPLPELNTDPFRLRQVVLNFLSNAIKYNHKNGSVKIKSEQRNSGKLRISVSDTGSGIPTSQQAHLFEAFNRLGRESGDIDGTGIGLSISKQISELLGGKISFKSREGEGSTFWIELPLRKQEPKPPEPGALMDFLD